jgi:hypothetical protein
VSEALEDHYNDVLREFREQPEAEEQVGGEGGGVGGKAGRSQ